jgi:hypothetical protein
MKTLSIISLSIIMLISCNQKKVSNEESTNENVRESQKLIMVLPSDKTFTFDNYETGKIPSGWSQYATGVRDITDWRILKDEGNKVLAQLSKEDVSGHYNEIVYDGLKVKNVELKVRLKGVSGERDQGGGFVWRFIDADNHYIVRANPLEDNVVLYIMENGVRTDLPLVGKGKTYGVDVEALGSGWNDLKLTVMDNIFTVYLNDKQLFQVEDKTFTEAGKVGLWTKADAETYFDDFQIINIK